MTRRKDFPWHIPDIKMGQSLVLNVALLLIIIGFYLIIGIVFLVSFIIKEIKKHRLKSRAENCQVEIEIIKTESCQEAESIDAPKPKRRKEKRQMDEETKRLKEVEAKVRLGKKWLAPIDERKYNHQMRLEEQDYIYIGTYKSPILNKWDAVYLYSVNQSRIRYMAYVVEVVVLSGDEKYAQELQLSGPTYKLKVISKNLGWGLNGPNLKKYYNIGVMTHPISIGDELMAFINKHYIEEPISL